MDNDKEFERLMSDEEPKDYVMVFGGHQGKSLEDIPLQYLDWIIGQKWLSVDVKKIIEEYLDAPVIQRELEADLGD